jgi:hypothetical protein
MPTPMPMSLHTKLLPSILGAQHLNRLENELDPQMLKKL